MFGLNRFIRYIISDVYHLSASESRTFDFCDFIFMRDFLLIEIYEVLGVRIKSICDGKKRCGFVFYFELEVDVMFGLKCFIRYIIINIYHLSASDYKSF